MKITHKQIREMHKLLIEITETWDFEQWKKCLKTSGIRDMADNIENLLKDIASNKPTNADKMRVKTDIQLAGIIMHEPCEVCPIFKECKAEFKRYTYECRDQLVEWLNQIAEEDKEK